MPACPNPQNSTNWRSWGGEQFSLHNVTKHEGVVPQRELIQRSFIFFSPCDYFLGYTYICLFICDYIIYMYLYMCICKYTHMNTLGWDLIGGGVASSAPNRCFIFRTKQPAHCMSVPAARPRPGNVPPHSDPAGHLHSKNVLFLEVPLEKLAQDTRLPLGILLPRPFVRRTPLPRRFLATFRLPPSRLPPSRLLDTSPSSFQQLLKRNDWTECSQFFFEQSGDFFWESGQKDRTRN